MREVVDLGQLQDRLYEILCAFADFCEENGLRYYLSSGTLLGAVRHQGFIPWDDDVDVAMPRPDYETFLRLTRKSPLENLEVHAHRPFPFAKVVDTRTLLLEPSLKPRWQSGLFVDVFPLDGVSDDPAQREAVFAQIRVLNRRFRLAAHPLSALNIRAGRSLPPLRRLLRTLNRRRAHLPVILLDCRFYSRRVTRAATRFGFEGAPCLTELVWGGGKQTLDKRDGWLKSVLLPFRDRKFSCPSNYDGILRRHYGDYLRVPDEAERPRPHGRFFVLAEGERLTRRKIREAAAGKGSGDA